MTNRLTLLFALFLSGISHAQSAGRGIGFVRLVTAGNDGVPVAVWYPTDVPSVAWHAGPYEVHATRGAEPASGRHALIILSHGSGGNEWGHIDLAEALVRRGYVVVAPRHLGDSYDRPDGRGTDVQMVGRPLQAVAAIDAVMADARLGPVIDRERIGMAGFSAGGYTALVLAGAAPDFGLVAEHCRLHGDDREVCGAASGKSFVTRTDWHLPVDRRVRAVVLMAPFSVVFDAAGLKDVSIPMLLYEARDDRVLPNAWNAERLAASLPNRPAPNVIEGGHFVFLAPCDADLRSVLPAALCDDAPGVDRVATHAAIDREIGDFFDREFR